MKEFEEFREKFLPDISKRILELLPSSSKYTPVFNRALSYSLKTEGKRIRPLLFLAVAYSVSAKKFKSRLNSLIDFSVGIEYIHNYSLVHDDIMDGDEIRRGKPTVFKKFGPDVAILVGDALLTRGMEILYDNFPYSAKVILQSVGVPGMISGQAGDIHYSGKVKTSESAMWWIHLNKTASFFAGISVAGILACSVFDEKFRKKFFDFGLNLGLAFQVRDDLLDRIGKKEKYKKSRTDLKNKKLTTLRFYTIEEAGEIVEKLTQNALNSLKNLPVKGEILKSLLKKLSIREM